MWRNGSVYNRHILNGSSVCLTCLWLHDAACQKSMQSDLQCKGTMKLFKGLASLGSIWQISQPVLNPRPLRVNRCHCRTSPGRAARNRCVFRSMASDRRIVQRLVFAFTVDESMNRWESSRNFTTCLRTTSKSVLELSVGNTGYPVGFQRQSFFSTWSTSDVTNIYPSFHVIKLPGLICHGSIQLTSSVDGNFELTATTTISKQGHRCNQLVIHTPPCHPPPCK